MFDTKTPKITHHAAGPIDGSGRMRDAEWRVYVPGWPTAYFPHNGTDRDKAIAHDDAKNAMRYMTQYGATA